MAKLKHIGILPDGNRRWALLNNINYKDAYEISMKKLASVIRFSFDFGASILSLYLLSKDNLKRQRDDIYSVIEAEIFFVKHLLPSIAKKYDCKVVPVGDLSLLPNDYQMELEKIKARTDKYSKRKIYILAAYDPIDEVNFAASSNKISMKDLWVSERVDCIVRTAGGPAMLSKFLPLQSSYAQIFMIKKYFQDTDVGDFDEVYKIAAKTKMKYGK